MFHSLTTRLIVWSLALTGAVYLTTIGLTNREGRRTAIAAAEREAHNSTEAIARAVEDVLDVVEASAAGLARTVSELHPTPDALSRLVDGFSVDHRGTVARYMVILAGSDATAPAWYPGYARPQRARMERTVPGL